MPILAFCEPRGKLVVLFCNELGYSVLNTIDINTFVRHGFRMFTILCLLLPTTSFAALGPAMAAPGKKKTSEDKPFLDPSLGTIEGQLSFDEDTKKALDRSKTPGVLIAAKEIPGHVYRIEIKGTKKIEPDAVVLRLSTRIGKPFNKLLVADDIIEIEKMGLFDDIKVYIKYLPSGAVVLRYEVVEYSTIFQVKIVGEHALDKDEILESIAGLEQFQVAKNARLKENAEKIRDFYVSKGYFLAQVDVKTEPTKEQDLTEFKKASGTEKPGTAQEVDTARAIAPDFVDVIFTIKENSKVKIERISISGNKHVSDDLIKASLRSQENHALSILTDWGTFRKDFLEIDVLMIEKILHDHGFLNAKVLPPDVELNADRGGITINYRIVENKQYRLGDVTIHGDLVESSDAVYRAKIARDPDAALFYTGDLQNLITQREGEVFNKSQMAENILAISEKYRDDGYAYVNVYPIPEFDEENNTVAINIQIESGPRVSIERIDIEGNTRTMDEVIRREMVIFEKERYSSSLIRLSESNIQRLGYFESVEVTNKPGSTPNQMVLAIKVKEQSTGSIQAGAGYGTGGEGLVLRGQISDQNLFGRGQTLSATINWSNNRRMFDVAFVEPVIGYLFDNPLTFAFTAYNRDIVMGEFSRRAFGGDITLGYPLGGPFAEISRKWKRQTRRSLVPYVFDFEALSFMLTYKAERVEISDVTNAVRKWDLYEGVPRYTTSIRPAIRLDQRDNRIFPSRGLYFEFSTEFATEYLGARPLASIENYFRDSDTRKRGLGAGRSYTIPKSDANNFIRYGTNFRFYHNLDDWLFLKGLVFKANMEMGILNTLGNPLLFENYSLGGGTNIRGYPYRTIAPVERAGALNPFDPRRDVRVGGNKQFYGSFELEFPIIKPLKISGVLFFDYGNVFSQDENFFYIGGKSAEAARITPADPLGIYSLLGLYSSVGFGVRWLSPLGYLRFEWGFPLNPRPRGTAGLLDEDPTVQFEFNIGPSF